MTYDYESNNNSIINYPCSPVTTMFNMPPSSNTKKPANSTT